MTLFLSQTQRLVMIEINWVRLEQHFLIISLSEHFSSQLKDKQLQTFVQDLMHLVICKMVKKSFRSDVALLEHF